MVLQHQVFAYIILYHPFFNNKLFSNYSTQKPEEPNLKVNLERLLAEFKSGKYKAPAVKRIFIPKGNSNEKRALGLPSFEDKILQRALLMVLEPVFEEYFYSFSHGFRPNHSAHLALDEFWLRSHKMNGGWLIDLDIRKYFDTIDHKHLKEMVLDRVCDGFSPEYWGNGSKLVFLKMAM